MTVARFGLTARTLIRLGIPNVLRVLLYRAALRAGVHPVQRVRHAPLPGTDYGDQRTGAFFRDEPAGAPPAPATGAWRDHATLFGGLHLNVGDEPPDWLASPVTGKRVGDTAAPWWEIDDFDSGVGDIKLIWEMSRLEWLVAFAQQFRHGDGAAVARMNGWLSDWCRSNPPYYGPNWKCGQEASIRVIHIATAAAILGQLDRAGEETIDLVRMHLKRISGTLQYAIAQDNNHGTSEAAALFIGGSWLRQAGIAQAWEQRGRDLLEERVGRLIAPDGSFSQYSVNYHRLVVDTLSIVEVWRRRMGAAPFSDTFQQRASAAARWLRGMTDPNSGGAPNIGANDGARLFGLGPSEFCDYRGSVQLAMGLFEDLRAYGTDGPWNDMSAWLGQALPTEVAEPPTSCIAADGGFAMVRAESSFAAVRFPRFRFRPSHADLLHLDFWRDGQNVLRDGGSYSYNAAAEVSNYFAGTASHNTIQFDGRDQMRRVSRFLFADWPRSTVEFPLEAHADGTDWGAGYSDYAGAAHVRRVRLEDGQLIVRDQVSGFQSVAVLRWRTAPNMWRLRRVSDRVVSCAGESAGLSMEIASTVPIGAAVIEPGWESIHYSLRSPIDVVRIEVYEAACLTTVLRWA